MNGQRRYPVAQPTLTDVEKKYVLDALDSGWISSRGPYLDRFEAEFATRCGVPTALATANGSVALHLILAAAGIGPGDEVIVPAMTYVATANAVRYCGADPVLVDVRPDTWCIDEEQVAAAVGPATRAVIAVDLYGRPAGYGPLLAICRAHELMLVDDAAESLGATVDGIPAGSFADASSFSFYGNKVMSSGEGGCVTTADRELAGRMRLLRNQGMDPDRRYWFPVTGYNYRLTNVAAGILCAQMERLDAMILHRETLIRAYDNAFAGMEFITARRQVPGTRDSPWLASFLLGPSGETGIRDRVMRTLDEMGVETRPFFVPLHRLPMFRNCRRAGRRLPVAEDLAARGINLPTYEALTIADVDEIAERVRRAAAVYPRAHRSGARQGCQELRSGQPSVEDT